MRTVDLGRTGLRVAEVGFGGIPIQRLSHEEAVAVVRGCLDLGVDFLDTAHGYTTSEERIGAAIAGRREGLVLASKTPAQSGPEAEAHLQESLRRLGVGYIELYQLHGVSDEERWQQVTAPGGPLEVLLRAQRQGIIGHVGVTSHQPDVAIEMARSGCFETMMFPLNFAGPEPGLKVLAACRREGVAFLAMKPMGGGMLEDPRVAFQFLRQFGDAIPVVGIERTAEMAEIVRLYDEPARLTGSDREEMARICQELGAIYCRRCGYCQPCPAGIHISFVMNALSFLKRMPLQQTFAPGGIKEAVDAVANCQDCGECESRCPYKLPIRERMAQVVELFREAEEHYLGSR
jgi:predicted aldo/keto reductase-like oxidoreductase